MADSVLVIDDFENVRRSVRSMLTAMGIRNVVEARDAKEALKAMQEQPFGFVFCDFNLGKGMDGQQLLEEAREQGILSWQTHFVIITAETTRDMVMGAIEHRPDDYLAKPFAFDTLKSRWARWKDSADALRPINQAIDQENYPAIINACEILIEKSTRYRSWAQRKLVETLILTGEIKRAEKTLKGFSSVRLLPWMQVDFGRIKMAEGSFEEAIDYFKLVIDEQPSYIAAFDLLAECYKELSEIEKRRETLERAVQVSPRNYVRQSLLAEVLEDTEAYKQSGKAFQQVINLTRGSAKETHLAYIRLLNVMGLNADQLDNSAKVIATKDISSLITKMTKKYHDVPEVKLTARIFRLMNQQRSKDLTPDQISDLLDHFEEFLPRAHSFNREIGLYMTRLLYNTNHFGDGDQLVDALRLHPHADDDFIGKLELLQSEPLSPEARKAALVLNRDAKLHYEKKDFKSALVSFREALQYSPRSPALILNYIQCGLIGGDIASPEFKRDAMEQLEKLSFMKKGHKQHDRFLKIRKRVASL